MLLFDCDAIKKLCAAVPSTQQLLVGSCPFIHCWATNGNSFVCYVVVTINISSISFDAVVSSPRISSSSSLVFRSLTIRLSIPMSSIIVLSISLVCYWVGKQDEDHVWYFLCVWAYAPQRMVFVLYNGGCFSPLFRDCHVLYLANELEHTLHLLVVAFVWSYSHWFLVGHLVPYRAKNSRLNLKSNCHVFTLCSQAVFLPTSVSCSPTTTYVTLTQRNVFAVMVAVVLTLGPERWNELRATYALLVKDTKVCMSCFFFFPSRVSVCLVQPSRGWFFSLLKVL